MQVGVAKYVNSVSKAGMTIGATTGRHTDRHVWTPFNPRQAGQTHNWISTRLTGAVAENPLEMADC